MSGKNNLFCLSCDLRTKLAKVPPGPAQVAQVRKERAFPISTLSSGKVRSRDGECRACHNDGSGLFMGRQVRCSDCDASEREKGDMVEKAGRRREIVFEVMSDLVQVERRTLERLSRTEDQLEKVRLLYDKQLKVGTKADQIIKKLSGSISSIQKKYERLEQTNKSVELENETLHRKLKELEEENKKRVSNRKGAVKKWKARATFLEKRLGKYENADKYFENHSTQTNISLDAQHELHIYCQKLKSQITWNQVQAKCEVGIHQNRIQELERKLGEAKRQKENAMSMLSELTELRENSIAQQSLNQTIKQSKKVHKQFEDESRKLLKSIEY